MSGNMEISEERQRLEELAEESVAYADARLGPRGQNDFIRIVGDDAHVEDNRLEWGPDGVVVEG